MSRLVRIAGGCVVLSAVCFAQGAAEGAEPSESPVPAPQPGASTADSAADAGTAGTARLGAPRRVVSPPPHVIGAYRVGHIHKPWLAHVFQYSAYNPYVDLIHQPYREVVYGNRHARYYATYRNLTAPQWCEMYVPAQVQTRTGTAQPITGVDPRARAPFGPGSATYFGAY